MISDEINEPMTGFDSANWACAHMLKEIAYQLAVLNESGKFENVAAQSRATRRGQVIAVLQKRVFELLNANNAEVERRRQVEKEKEVALSEVEHWRNILKNLNFAERSEPKRMHTQLQVDSYGLAERSEPKRDAVGKRDTNRVRCECGCAYPDHFQQPADTGTQDDSIPQPIVQAVREHLETKPMGEPCPMCGGNNGAHKDFCRG